MENKIERSKYLRGIQVIWKEKIKSIQEGIQVHSREGFSSQLLNIIQELI